MAKKNFTSRISGYKHPGIESSIGEYSKELDRTVTQEDVRKQYIQDIKNMQADMRKFINNRLSANQGRGTKFVQQNYSYREALEGIQNALKIGNRKANRFIVGMDEQGNPKEATRLDQLSFEQVKIFRAKLFDWSRQMTPEGYKDVMYQRMKGIADFLDKKDETGNYTIAQGDRGYALSYKGKQYRMSYDDVSDFWRKFRAVYDANDLKNLKEYEDEGVSIVFDLYYQDRDISPDDLIKEIHNKYEEQVIAQKKKMIRAETDMKNIGNKKQKRKSSMLR